MNRQTDNSKKYASTALLALACATVAGPAVAQEAEARWFQVEVIIFANNNLKAIDSELWPDNPGHPDLDRAILLSPSTSAQTASGTVPISNVSTPAYQLLNDTDLALKEIADKLARSPAYRPLLHLAWRQPAVSPEQAQSVYIHDRVAEYSSPLVPTPADAGAGSVILSDNPTDLVESEPGPDAPQISGIFRLGLSRYLHLQADLIFRLPLESEETVSNPDFTPDEPAAQAASGIAPEAAPAISQRRTVLRSFRLTESRRMRSKEIHYYDHPLFGIVALITPVELPTAPPPGPGQSQ